MESNKFTPIEVELKKGKSYYWCQCGASKTQPFCDGSHSGYFCEPIHVTVKEDQKRKLCTCKKSANKPFCDGTHTKL